MLLVLVDRHGLEVMQTNDITIDEDLTVSKDVLVKGNLTVQGVETIVKSNIVQITDKNIELAAVVSTQFVATVTSGTPNITSITPTAGLIPGMTVTTSTGGITIPNNTTMFLSQTIVLSYQTMLQVMDKQPSLR